MPTETTSFRTPRATPVERPIGTGDSAPLRVAITTASITCRDLFAIPLACPWLPQIAWVDSRTGSRWLGLGQADQLVASDAAGAWGIVDRCRERLGRIEASPDVRRTLRYFGGIAFDPESPVRPEWPAGSPARFVLPRVLLHQANEERATVTVVLPADATREQGGDQDDVPSILRTLRRCAAEVPGVAVPRFELPEIAGHRDRWEASVRRALEAIESGEIRKIVLSRDLVLAAEEPIDPWTIVRRIQERRPHGLQFCFRFDSEAAFLGATPERLVGQRGDEVVCDCLAGTGPRGDDEEEDPRRARELLASEKDRREHRFVLDGIVAALQPLARWLEHPAGPTVLRLPKLHHLSSPVRGSLRPEARLGDLVERLHPTPAVGGSPRNVAVGMIRALEDRPRGWYAGPIGWIGYDAADLAVGIRSAIVRGSRAIVTGGAGIVEGSDPEAEWDETARKALSFLSLFTEVG